MESFTQDTQKPQDQRVRLTKALLKDAFLQLLCEKPVQNVTVKELCEAAGVNRGTFYQHYKDVYDLLGQLEDEMLADLDVLLAQNPVIVFKVADDTAGSFVSSIFQFFENNREMCAILLGENGDKKFVANIIERGRAKSVREYMEMYPQISQQKAEIFYAFIAWGFIGLIQYALQNNQALPAQVVAQSAERIVKSGARFFEMP